MKKWGYILSGIALALAVAGCRSKEEDASDRIMENRERFIQLLLSTGRPGMESVISHLDSTDFFTRSGGGHHTEPGGLVQHSLEVYKLMKGLAWFQDSGSIAIVALFHDMGKIDEGGWHTWRSVKHLSEWGLEMTDEEYLAIFRHHNLEFKYYRHALCRTLIVADAISSAWWKLRHRKK